MKRKRLYTGEHTSQISFPLGGIGSGCIGLAGNGNLIDWEIFNAPNKNTFNNYSGFAVKAYEDGLLKSAKVLVGPCQPPYMGMNRRNESLHSGYGFGPNEKTFAGFPHFETNNFLGEFPIAQLEFEDPQFPGKVHMKAFNPFIPLNDRDSSIPCAMFEISLINTGTTDLEYAVCLFAGSSFSQKQSINTFENDNGVSRIVMGTDVLDEKDLDYGQICLATDGKDVSYQQYWYRGMWKDNTEMFWNDFTTGKRFENRVYGKGDSDGKDAGLICAHMHVAAGSTKSVRFVISWNYPNINNSWNKNADKTPWRNYYATIFDSASTSAVYSLVNWDRLCGETEMFRDAIYSSTLEEHVLEAVTSNLSVLKTPTCLRLEDGSFYGFEGCLVDEGSCEGSCTHVWNYAYAMPYLFPRLERSMRENDFNYNQWPSGKMSFRINLPLGSEPNNFRACVDGQMGGVIKAYREWKISGDSMWLKEYWPKIKRSLEYAWSPENPDRWDPNKSGVITGRQHHTLDMELFGANSWLNGFYLAALKAGAEMAEFLGYDECAKEYRSIFEKGKEYTDRELFNGEYYYQKIDLSDYDFLASFFTDDESPDRYWDEESKQIKYQIGDGCVIDQVLPQWHANLVGLGEIYNPNQVYKALKSLYKYNFKSMNEVANFWRVFSLNDEKGLIICSWPREEQKPTIPLTYSTETMTGFEYQAACHMIQEGLVEEGIEVVKAIRTRFDGVKRNPWNEFECGSNYARSMASYSLLLAFSGYSYDGVKKELAFNPIEPENFIAFYSCGSAWGKVSFEKSRIKLDVLYGNLCLNKFSATNLKQYGMPVLDGKSIKGTFEKDSFIFENGVEIKEGSSLSFNA